MPKDGHTIPVDPDDPTKGNITQKCGTSEYVCSSGPGYNLFSPKFKPGSNSHTYPYDPQSDTFSGLNGAAGYASTSYSAEQLPIKSTLAKEFGVFNKMYCSVPSASTPNHLFIQSATSCGEFPVGQCPPFAPCVLSHQWMEYRGSQYTVSVTVTASVHQHTHDGR